MHALEDIGSHIDEVVWCLTYYRGHYVPMDSWIGCICFNTMLIYYQMCCYCSQAVVLSLVAAGKVTAGLAWSNGRLPPGGWLKSPVGWLPVHRDQLRVQRSVTSMGSFYLLNPCFTGREPCWRRLYDALPYYRGHYVPMDSRIGCIKCVAMVVRPLCEPCNCRSCSLFVISLLLFYSMHAL